MNNSKPRVIVAMSGGVDSSVAAALLAESGHDVVGVTLKLLPRGGEGFGCCGSPDDVLIAKRSAEKIGIPHYVLDYSPDFEQNVVNYFVNSYLVGETPNPCLACNRHIKFDKLRTFAQTLDASFLATGHYARIIPSADGSAHRLFEAVDPNKDQSYVLYNLTRSALASTFFPVGHKAKTEIRSVARTFGLPNADKEDSQEICFVPNRDYKSFVQKKLANRPDIPITAQPGPIKDESGRTIGEHQGVAFYTVGQRKGLGSNLSEKKYVTKLDASSNTVTVGSDLTGLDAGLVANDLNWIAGHAPAVEFNALVKIRYKHDPAPAHVTVNGSSFRVRFDTPQRAVSPGQAAVLYRWDENLGAREVIGGGKITEALHA